MCRLETVTGEIKVLPVVNVIKGFLLPRMCFPEELASSLIQARDVALVVDVDLLGDRLDR